MICIEFMWVEVNSTLVLKGIGPLVLYKGKKQDIRPCNYKLNEFAPPLGSVHLSFYLR